MLKTIQLATEAILSHITVWFSDPNAQAALSPPSRDSAVAISQARLDAQAKAGAGSVGVQSSPRRAGETHSTSATGVPAHPLARQTLRGTIWQVLLFGLCCPLGPQEWVRIVLNPPDSLF